MLIVKTASEILDEIRLIRGLDSDAALGEIFGVKQSTVASWRSRNSLPYENVIDFCVKEGISTDTLFLKQRIVKISGTLYDAGRQFTRTYELDDLFSTRLIRELKGRTVAWLASESLVDKGRIEKFIEDKDIPTLDELESMAGALKVSTAWLAEKSTSSAENWMYEYYKKDSYGCFSAKIYRQYLVAAEKIIEQMGGLITLSSELKAHCINTACRVHLKETPYRKEANSELMRFLLALAR